MFETETCWILFVPIATEAWGRFSCRCAKARSSAIPIVQPWIVTTRTCHPELRFNNSLFYSPAVVAAVLLLRSLFSLGFIKNISVVIYSLCARSPCRALNHDQRQSKTHQPVTRPTIEPHANTGPIYNSAPSLSRVQFSLKPSGWFLTRPQGPSVGSPMKTSGGPQKECPSVFFQISDAQTTPTAILTSDRTADEGRPQANIFRNKGPRGLKRLRTPEL